MSCGITTHEFYFHKNGTLNYESHGDAPPTEGLKIGAPVRKVVALKDRKPNGSYFIQGDTLTMQTGDGEFVNTYKISLANKEKYIEFGGYKLAGNLINDTKTPTKVRKRKNKTN